jgi:hypothetical protein
MTLISVKNLFKKSISIGNLILLYFKYFTSKKNGIKICISTTKSYANETIPILVNQLVECNVNMEDIFVFEGGHNAYSVNKSVRYHHYLTNHNSFDLTSLISILELNLYSEHWLLLHDTIEIDKSFKIKFFTINPNRYDCMPLTNFPSMNIGIYSNEFLLKNKDFILKQKNEDYSCEKIQETKKNAIEMEDYLFQNSNNIKLINYHVRHLSNSKIVNYKNSNRLREYYSQLGLIKYKANFERKEIYIVHL